MIDVRKSDDINSSDYDCIVAVNDSITNFSNDLNIIANSLMQFKEFNPRFESSLTVIPTSALRPKKLIFSPTYSLNGDYDDSRRISEASNAGIKMAIELGVKRPLLVFGDLTSLPKDRCKWASREYVEINMILGAIFAAYVPIEIREDVPSRSRKLDYLGVYGVSERSIFIASGLEEGRRITRDICGSDPERMAAPRIVDYIEDEFKDSGIKIVVETVDSAKYPLMAAVNRAASLVERHDGRVVKLEYDSNDDVEDTIFLIGKGIIYDTGGADVKTNGIMVGMHRDKSGAAAITGFFKTLSLLKPKRLKVVGLCAYVRNSIGEESYVSDEIITSRANKRVRVINTDAEGRMAMGDLLCEAKEMALNAINPALFTIATLTGHVRRTYGLAYTAVMGNGYSCQRKIPQLLQDAGNLLSEPVEISTIRREDMEFAIGFNEYEDIIQCHTLPSVDISRGHQFAAAFLVLASGLDAHDSLSRNPLPYTHLDIAGSSGRIGSLPTAVPLLMFAVKYIIPKLF